MTVIRPVQARHPRPSDHRDEGPRHVRAEGTNSHKSTNYARAYADEVVTQEKAKRNAWQKLVDDGVKPLDAQKKYIALVKSLKEKYGYSG